MYTLVFQVFTVNLRIGLFFTTVAKDWNDGILAQGINLSILVRHKT